MKVAMGMGFFDGNPQKFAKRVQNLEASGVDLV